MKTIENILKNLHETLVHPSIELSRVKLLQSNDIKADVSNQPALRHSSSRRPNVRSKRQFCSPFLPWQFGPI